MKNSYTVLAILVFLICNFLTFFTDGDNYTKLSTLGVLSLMELVVFIMVDYKQNKNLTFATIFILVLFLFHFGQLMLYTFFKNVYPHIRFLILLDVSKALWGGQMINMAFSVICIGILLKESNIKRTVTVRQRYYNEHLDWNRVGMNIIKATFFVKFALDFVTLGITLTAGGEVARAWVNSFPNILLYYGKISLVGFAILIIANKYNPLKQKKIYLFITCYILIMMMSGIRSENVGYLVVFLFIYIASHNKSLKFKSALLYGIVGFLMLGFVVAVGKFRSVSTDGLYLLGKILTSSFVDNNIIFGVMDNMGDTSYTAQAVINNWLPNYSPSWGDAYWMGWTAAIPNLAPFIIDFGAITMDSSFPIKLQQFGVLSQSYENIGGSVIGELFFNFGLTGGVIAALFLGMFIGWVSKKSSLYLQMDNYYGLILMVPIMFATVYWVRDYFGGGVREAVWGPLLCYYIVKHTKRIKI